MDKDEKVDFILEQMRLCLAKKDYVRTQIISKKISTRFFTTETGPVQVGVASQHGGIYLHYIAFFLHMYFPLVLRMLFVVVSLSSSALHHVSVTCGGRE